jgi:glutaminyl-peptide cyclotransferase
MQDMAAREINWTRASATSRRGFALRAVLAIVVLAAIASAAAFVLLPTLFGEATAAPTSNLKLADIPFDGAAAYDYLKQLCAIGPRPSGSPGIATQQKLLIDHFTKLGGHVSRQEFTARNPLTGEAVPMVNILVQWHPDRKERVLLCAHYDTRPFPDRDPHNPRGTFVGASDSASGVAILMQLGKAMPKFQSSYGVDFLLVDGEDFVFGDIGTYCLGSEYFATTYAAEPPPYKYRWGVVLDMVGDADLQIYQERHGVQWKDTKPLVDSLWQTAKRLGVKEFVPQVKFEIVDDHLKLRNIAGIATCDIIDFDYPAWHTQADDPAHCSALSLAKVGWVIDEWLQSLK